MQPISDLTPKEAKLLKVVFTDIDDTLSLHGKIFPEAYQSMWDLFRAGIHVVPITGRASGWVDHIARMWPVKGVVGENGALYMYLEETEGVQKLKKRYYLQPAEVANAKKKFENIKNEVFNKFPSVKIASDQPYREFDLAIDFCEDVPPLNLDQVQEIVKIYEKYGATTKISSIHVNGWFGDYDKLTMTKIFAQEILGFSLENNKEWCLFVGDSPNDQPMFQFFPNSVGVRNIEKFIPQIKYLPKYITKEEGSYGFAEMVKIILQKRKK